MTPETKPSSTVVWLKPRNKKLPLVAIPVDQAPHGFLQYHEEYQKRFFVVSLPEGYRSSKSTGII
jgi:protein SSD1